MSDNIAWFALALAYSCAIAGFIGLKPRYFQAFYGNFYYFIAFAGYNIFVGNNVWQVFSDYFPLFFPMSFFFLFIFFWCKCVWCIFFYFSPFFSPFCFWFLFPFYTKLIPNNAIPNAKRH